MAQPAIRLVDESSSRKLPRKFGFTVKTLNAVATPKLGRVYVYDTRTPHLTLCVTDKGHRSFYLYRRGKQDVRPRRWRLGGFPELSVEQARDKAAEMNGDIARGIDPQARVRASRQEMTLGELFSLYLEQHAKPHKRTWEEDEALFNRHLSQWRGRKLSEVTKAEVAALHGRLGTKPQEYTIKSKSGKAFKKKYPSGSPVAANRVVELLRGLFKLAADHGFAAPNPATGIKQFSERSRERFLQAEELPAFFKALKDDPSEKIRDFFMVALLCGARRGNIEGMRWENLNLDAGTWEIPAADFKTNKPTTVYLSEQIVAILKRRKATSESRWVFPGKGASGHLEDPMRGWRGILARAGIKDLRIHDLRRSLASWMASGGTSLPVVGKALGHASQSATAIYARLNIDAVRVSVDAAITSMMSAGAVKSKKKTAR